MDSFTEIKQGRTAMLWNNSFQTILNGLSGGIKEGDQGVQALQVEGLCSAGALQSLEAKRSWYVYVIFTDGSIFIKHCMMRTSAKWLLPLGVQTGAWVIFAGQIEATISVPHFTLVLVLIPWLWVHTGTLKVWHV